MLIIIENSKIQTQFGKVATLWMGKMCVACGIGRSAKSAMKHLNENALREGYLLREARIENRTFAKI